jgi:hypothetical protein
VLQIGDSGLEARAVVTMETRVGVRYRMPVGGHVRASFDLECIASAHTCDTAGGWGWNSKVVTSQSEQIGILVNGHAYGDAAWQDLEGEDIVLTVRTGTHNNHDERVGLVPWSTSTIGPFEDLTYYDEGTDVLVEVALRTIHFAEAKYASHVSYHAAQYLVNRIGVHTERGGTRLEDQPPPPPPDPTIPNPGPWPGSDDNSGGPPDA